MIVIKKIEIEKDELIKMCENQIDVDADTIDNRDRLFDSLIDYGIKSDDKENFVENLLSSINVLIGFKEFNSLMQQYKEDYLED